MSEPQTTKVGSYDKLILANDKEINVLIQEDTPTKMLMRIIETGEVMEVHKHGAN